MQFGRYHIPWIICCTGPYDEQRFWKTNLNKKKIFLYLAAWGHAVVQFVEALHYKPEGRRFNSHGII
jgi:hypothetical protein